MIVDAFLYAGETEMLDLRLRTLRPVVDLFIPVMCSVTHQGEPATPWTWAYEAGTLDLRAPNLFLWIVEPKEVNPAGERGGVGTRWYQTIERQHRDGIRDACEAAGLDGYDFVMCSDVDEIPHPSAVHHALGEFLHGPYRRLVFEQRFHSTALNVLHPQQPWLGTTCSYMKDLHPQQDRDDRGPLFDASQSVVNGGWHFSWFGTDEERARKLDTFSHAELRGQYDPAEGRRTLRHANGEELRRLTPTEIETLDWPAPLLDGTFRAPDCWYL